jgi:Cof subfamily protein (haloacid dehalogenase superfamily)
MSKESILKNIKFILSDLDGTILNNKSELEPETKKIIAELISKGVQFSLASGRLHSAMVLFAKELNLDLPIISLDGCYIKDLNSSEPLYCVPVKEKHVLKAVTMANQLLVNIALCHAEAIYFTESNSLIPQLMDKYGAVYQEVRSYNGYLRNTLEIVLAGDDKESILKIKNRLEEPFSFGLTTSYFCSRTHQGIYYLEIRKRSASKGKGFLRLIKALKIKENASAVIGDWYNDISLFETNAFKVALENSVPELKRKTDFVIPKTNDEDGAAEFFEMVLRAKTS